MGGREGRPSAVASHGDAAVAGYRTQCRGAVGGCVDRRTIAGRCVVSCAKPQEDEWCCTGAVLVSSEVAMKTAHHLVSADYGLLQAAEPSAGNGSSLSTIT